jgi:hypothetical protein
MIRMAWAAAVFLTILTAPPLAVGAEGKVSGPDDPDFKIQGEYTGTIQSPNGPSKIGVQVIALGDGKFHAVGHRGGLPGDGWDGSPKHEVDGEAKDGAARFTGEDRIAEANGAVMKMTSRADNMPVGELTKTERKSPSQGAKPPTGAVVLFDGTSTGADQFSPGRIEDGLLVAGATSKRKFGSCQLHVEFLLPFMPAARGQGRSNSGVYLQGRYEVQMLDSFGLRGENNECGGIYSIKRPDLNMCFPPLSWQTYDIYYTAAKFDGDKKVKNAVMTVEHNGIVVHHDVELPHATTAAPIGEGPDPGPIYLQDHGNPVRYRNIWLVEKP